LIVCYQPDYILHSGMEQMKIKFIADQAKSVYRYKNTEAKLLQCCANIHFSKQCLLDNVTPLYAGIKVMAVWPKLVA
jgi:hypothetical protein